MVNVLVLNADYSINSVIGWQTAMINVHLKRVEVVEYSDIEIRTPTKTYLLPAIIRFVKMVRQIYKKKINPTSKNILTRDKFTCQYCSRKTNLTIDHVVPKKLGGKSTWENMVACCQQCNIKKSDFLPREIKMYPKNQPKKPTIMEFALRKINNEGFEKLVNDLFE